MKVRELLKLTDMKYAKLENACGFEFGYLQNRRYKQVKQLPAIDVYQLSKVLNVSIEDLLTLTSEDIREISHLSRVKTKSETAQEFIKRMKGQSNEN